MARAVYSYLFVGTERTVAVLGARIYVLDSATGKVLAQSLASETTTQDKSGLIIAATVNEDSTHLLTVGENKILSVWRLPGLDLVNERELPKRPTGLAFTKDSETIIVSDKFGDVFSYPFTYTPSTTKTTRDDFSSHENPSDGHLVLGHASPLNAFLLSLDEKYIITADRDEHIRVSWYPQGYNIEMYCLGHRKYVSAIHVPAFSPETLISGGGDPNLKIWNWMSGQCINEVHIWDAVEPFVAVKKTNRSHVANDNEEGGAIQKRKGKGKKSKKRADKRTAQAMKNEEGKGEDAEEDKQDEEIEPNKGENHDGNEIVTDVVEQEVLVINQINSVQIGDSKFVIFCAVGVTALFGFQYPTGTVEYFYLDHPVIHFALDSDSRIWVSLDTNRSMPGTTGHPKDSIPVRVVQFTERGKLVEVSSAEIQYLLRNLNETAARDVQEEALDFYADLKDMPKWTGPFKQATTLEGEDDAGESISSGTITKPLTRREEARMKNKKNVLGKMQELQNEPPYEKGKIGTVRTFEEVEDSGVEARATKRAKEVVQNTGEGDVEMGG